MEADIWFPIAIMWKHGLRKQIGISKSGGREVSSECFDIACSHYRFATELALKALDIASGRHPDFYACQALIADADE